MKNPCEFPRDIYVFVHISLRFKSKQLADCFEGMNEISNDEKEEDKVI